MQAYNYQAEAFFANMFVLAQGFENHYSDIKIIKNLRTALSTNIRNFSKDHLIGIVKMNQEILEDLPITDQARNDFLKHMMQYLFRNFALKAKEGFKGAYCLPEGWDDPELMVRVLRMLRAMKENICTLAP